MILTLGVLAVFGAALTAAGMLGILALERHVGFFAPVWLWEMLPLARQDLPLLIVLPVVYTLHHLWQDFQKFVESILQA